MDNQTQTAINASLCCKWGKAIELNKEILKEHPNDINTLNRLAYAHIQTGEIEMAKKTYRKILLIDRYNHIAKKNLDKISSLPKNIKARDKKQNHTSPLSPNLFIEEPGKTKTLSLIHLAPCIVLSRLNVGDLLYFYPKRHSIEVRTREKIYVGALPDDVSFRLIRFLKAGNIYQVSVKNVTKNCLAIFIREEKRGKRFQNQPSFIYPSVTHLSGNAKEIKANTSLSSIDEEKPCQEDEET